MRFECGFKNGLLVFLPALDLKIFQFRLAEGFDEGFCETCVRHQRDVMIDGATTDAVAVGQFSFAVVFGIFTIRSNWWLAIILITLFSAFGRSSGQNTGVVGMPCEFRKVAVPAVA